MTGPLISAAELPPPCVASRLAGTHRARRPLPDGRAARAGGVRRRPRPGAAYVDLDTDLAAPPGRGRAAPAARHGACSRPRCAGPASPAAGRSWCTTTGPGRRPAGPGGCCATTATRTSGCSTVAGRPGSPGRRGRDRGPGHGRPRGLHRRPGHLPLVEADDVPAVRCWSTRGRPSATAASTSRSTRWRATSPERSTCRPPATSTDDGRFRPADELRALYAEVGATPDAGDAARWRRTAAPGSPPSTTSSRWRWPGSAPRSTRAAGAAGSPTRTVLTLDHQWTPLKSLASMICSDSRVRASPLAAAESGNTW